MVWFIDWCTIVSAHSGIWKVMHFVQFGWSAYANGGQTGSQIGEGPRRGRWQFSACGWHFQAHLRNVHQCAIDRFKIGFPGSAGSPNACPGTRMFVRKIAAASRNISHGRHTSRKRKSIIISHTALHAQLTCYSYRSVFFFLQIHRDLSGEAAQLMADYSRIAVGIDKEWLLACIPECWAAFVTLKVEYYKGKQKLHWGLWFTCLQWARAKDKRQPEVLIFIFNHFVLFVVSMSNAHGYAWQLWLIIMQRLA